VPESPESPEPPEPGDDSSTNQTSSMTTMLTLRICKNDTYPLASIAYGYYSCGKGFNVHFIGHDTTGLVDPDGRKIGDETSVLGALETLHPTPNHIPSVSIMTLKSSSPFIPKIRPKSC